MLTTDSCTLYLKNGNGFTRYYIPLCHWEEREATGSYETDAVDERFCRLVMDIQYRCQHHFFGAFAYNYYDNQARDAAANATNHNTRYAQCFRTLPENFSKSQFVEHFGLANGNSATSQLQTLVNERAIRRVKRDSYVKLVANL